MLHLHIAMALALAVTTAGAVYLYVVSTHPVTAPMKTAGIVLLTVLAFSSLLYISYYGMKHWRQPPWREDCPTVPAGSAGLQQPPSRTAAEPLDSGLAPGRRSLSL